MNELDELAEYLRDGARRSIYPERWNRWLSALEQLRAEQERDRLPPREPIGWTSPSGIARLKSKESLAAATVVAHSNDGYHTVPLYAAAIGEGNECRAQSKRQNANSQDAAQEGAATQEATQMTAPVPRDDAAPPAEPVAQQPSLRLPSNETLRQQIKNDPDDEPSAGDYECTR